MDRRVLLALGCVWLWLAACRAPGVGAGPADQGDAERADAAAASAPIAIGPAWPRITPGIESRYFSSFDRTGGNADGFAGRYATLYKLPSGEHVIFDALGPGVLNTLWFTGPKEGGEGLDLGAIRFYFDGEQRARIVTDVTRLFGGKQAPFLRPLVADNHVSTGGFVSWVPLCYRERLVVTTERKPAFFIGQYDSYPADAPVQSWQPDKADERIEQMKRLFGAAAKGAGQGAWTTVALDHQQQGSGTIEAIRFEPATPATAEQLAAARVRIYWDGDKAPGVDVPLGMFFGSGLGEAKVRAAAFAIDPRGAYENRLPMPFWRGFRIQVIGIEGRLGLRLGRSRFTPNEAGHLHAVYSEASPTRPGEDFEWLDLEGSGKLVATVLTIRPPTPETKKWWEGDLRSYVDGRRTPGLHGTGHEDDHLGGWSNTFFEGPFTLPMHGEPRSEIIEHQGVQYNARITLYRLWPGIHFAGSIRHSVEHGNENSVGASYAGVAFFYALAGGARLKQTDRIDLGDPASRRSHRFEVDGPMPAVQRLTSAFEGRGYKDPVTDDVLAHAAAVTLELAATPDNRGCYLRRTYDQQSGQQRARVLVNGRHLTDWYIAEGNRALRWAERDLFIPPAITNKPALRIRLEPVDRAWNAAEYRLLCIKS